ncbi:FxsA family protein [Pleomorphomonas sp. NRK KF1]|uniref:FxsA family protein n=1 Tax=Pleomorphomonas sp. NRK KF1 TaxID=2943000 RepID=UPI002044B92B|nr:FxsA family protein [Pleomorphomonas sp. NRK KF1]MCM5554708.1 FxsA family protein [Pleomorphomonas sp. NRK KF1]
MRLSPYLPFLLIAWPIAEIATLVWVGGHLGVINTVGLVLLAAFGGLALFRYVGFGLLRRVQGELTGGRMPSGTLLEGFVVLLAGVLLILPGFLSDVLAFLLLFAPIRRLIIGAVAARVTVSTATSGYGRPKEDGVVDLDENEWESRGNGDSPWSDHTPIPPPDRDGDRS